MKPEDGQNASGFGIGQTVTHFKILAKLGEGGMGMVYKAQDLRLERIVALKCLLPGFTSGEEEKRRFLHEAQASSILDHPNIGTLYNIEETPDGKTFIVMAFYEGEPLRKRLERGVLPLQQALSIAVQIADGMGEAHEHDIVHRDLKPANVMLTKDNLVKIVDFGIAKLSGRTRLTQTGAAVGTVSYMSPEQATGAEVDARSDIWALGVVLYEMLSGQLPFEGDSFMSVAHAVLHKSPEPITSLRRDVPGEVEGILNKCLEKDRSVRYQHMGEVADDLRRLMGGAGGGTVTRIPTGGTTVEAIAQPRGKEYRRLAAIMFTDMVGYSALTQKNESLALELLDEQRRLVRPLFPKHHGKEIEAVGDGFFVEFASALEATRCAVEIQQMLHDRNTPQAQERHIRLRIGLHLGDVVVRENRVHGDGVNIAARIEPLAEPNGICISEDIARQIQNKIGLPLQKLGKGELKNIQLSVAIYRVVLPWGRKHRPVLDPVTFMFRRKKFRGYVVSGVAIAVGLALGVKYYVDNFTRPPIKSIAIIPFVRANDIPDYLADGLTRDVSKRLRGIPNLRVMSDNASFRYRGKAQDLTKMGKALNVHSILTGKIAQSGEEVSLIMELFDTRSNDVIWRKELKRNSSELLGVAQSTAQELVSELEIPLSDKLKQKVERQYTNSKSAYDLYLRGLYYIYRLTKDDNGLAIEYFSQSLEKDSLFVPALVKLAYVQHTRYENGWETDPQVLENAMANCGKALRLDSLEADATAYLGVIQTTRNDLDLGIALSEKARTIDQDNMIALTQLGYIYLFTGSPAKAVTYFKRVQEIDPFWSGAYSNIGAGYLFMKNVPEARVFLRRAVTLNPGDEFSWSNLGILYEMVGRPDSALLCHNKAFQISPNNLGTVEKIGGLLLAVGEIAAAESVFVQAVTTRQNDPSLMYFVGMSHLLRGDLVHARETFQQGLSLVQQTIPIDSSAGLRAMEGLFHARLGNILNARESARRAFAQDSTDSDVAIRVARTYAVLDEKPGMVEAFKRARALKPVYPLGGYDGTYVLYAVDFDRYKSDPELLAAARQ